MEIWLVLWMVFLVTVFTYNYYKISKLKSIKSNYGKPVKGKVIHLDKEKREIVVETIYKKKTLHVALAFRYGRLKSSQNEIDNIFESKSKVRHVYINKKDLRLSSLTNPMNIVPYKNHLACLISISLCIFSVWVFR